MSARTLLPPSAGVAARGTGTRPGRTRGSGTLDPVRAYARSVVTGKTIAGKLVRQACQRHLDDIAHGAERGLIWDLGEAQRVIDLIGQMPQPGGAPFVVQPSQAFIVGSIFGWQMVGGGRRFRTAYIEEAKGNGKTPLAARIGIVLAAADGRHGAEVYTAGVTRDQANYVLNDARLVIEASDTLKSLFDVGAHNLAVLATDSFIRPVSSEARSLDQKRVHGALVDEIHEHETPLVVEKLRAGTKGDPDALIVETTNSGYNRHSICWQHHQYSRQVLSGTIPNDSWFAFIAAIDEGDDYTDEAVWPKANPLLDVTVTRRYLREQVQEARDMPPKAALVQRLNFCVWTEASVGAIEMGKWDGDTPELRAALSAPVAIPASAVVYAGLDLASTTDLTAFLMLREDEDGYLELDARIWCPAEGLAMRSRRDHVPYELWAKEGWITPTEGNVTDYDVVRTTIRDLAARYAIREIAYDRWNATQLVTQLMSDGATMVPVGQGFASMSAPTKEWLARIAGCKVRHGGNPVLRWMAANLVVEQDAAGNLKPSKAKSTERIDGHVAAIMALSRLTAPHEEVSGPGFLAYTKSLASDLPWSTPSAEVAVLCAVRARAGAVIASCGLPPGHAGGHTP